MKVNVINRKAEGDHKVRVTVRLNDADRAELVAEAMEGIRAQLGLDADKNPDLAQSLIEGMGLKALNNMIGQQVATRVAPAAINEFKLKPMFAPVCVLRERQSFLDEGDIEFMVEIITKPTYELSSYEPVTIEMPEAKVTDEMVKDQMSQIAERFATYEPTEGSEINEGDCAKATMRTTKDGEAVSGLSGEDQIVHLERGLMPDGFIDGIIGIKVGETREFDFEAPAWGSEDKDATETFHLKITVKEKLQRVIPAITDEFVKKTFVGYAETAAEYEEKVRTEMQDALDEEYKNQRDAQVDALLAERLVGSVDDIFYERTRDELSNQLMRQIQAQGMTFDDFLEQQGMEKQQFQMMLMMQTASVLRTGFALDAVYRHVGEKIDEADIAEALSQMAPGFEEQARADFDENGTWFAAYEVAERIRAHRWALEHAIIK